MDQRGTPQIWGRIFCFFVRCPLGPKGTPQIWGRIFQLFLSCPLGPKGTAQIWGHIFRFFLSCPLGPKGTAQIWVRIWLDLLWSCAQRIKRVASLIVWRLFVLRTLLLVWCLQEGGNLHNVPRLSSLGLCFSSGANRGPGIYTMCHAFVFRTSIPVWCLQGAGIYTMCHARRLCVGLASTGTFQ